ncbi:MAG TPA: glycosyl hydrolase family 18 protein [Bryobacteraceae bacterium]|nr:glycosyl hydrolase family 18 protein [Bryobacteraceae bacterium]
MRTGVLIDCKLIAAVWLALPVHFAAAQGTVPVFQRTVGQSSYTILGRDPAAGETTNIPAVLVPLALSFDSRKIAGKPLVMDAAGDVQPILASPIFSKFPFPDGDDTQYADALLRATFPNSKGWHTLLGHPETKPLRITIPTGSGYVLTSKTSGDSIAVVDLDFVKKELFKHIPKREGELIVAITHNTVFYALGDATVCCSWGTHGVDSATGNSFVLGSFLDAAAAPVQERDIQPLTQQLGELINDPLHDPDRYGGSKAPGNIVPAWLRPVPLRPGEPRACGGTGIATTYFLLAPTDTNARGNIPVSPPFAAPLGGSVYHLQNMALLPWYAGVSANAGRYSFPDPRALTEPAQPCPPRPMRDESTAPAPPPDTPAAAASNGHKLIGYWVGHGPGGSLFPLRDVSPQWDIVIVAFATPDKHAPEGTLQFRPPAGFTAEQLKTGIADLQSRGKKVMISLGGGGEFFSLNDPKRIPDFVSSVARIVSEYGFDGIDLDFETPSLVLQPGDIDFRHPTTPSIVNLISGLRQLHHRFGPGFMISLVPEGTQMPAGYTTYGGQFGSYLPIAYAIRDILSFLDAQDYNTPPLQGLDGEIYQLASGVDYHAAMTEILLHGFPVGGDPNRLFPPFPPDQIAVGFLTGETTPAIVSASMDYLITGKPAASATYKLRKAVGYPRMIGPMFWTIDADRRASYEFSHVIGNQLHRYPLPQ